MTKDPSHAGSPSSPASQADGLAALVRALGSDVEWPTLSSLLLAARTQAEPLAAVHEMVRALCSATASIPPALSSTMADEIRTARRQAAALLIDRVGDKATLAEDERKAIITAAELLTDAGDIEAAAEAFERGGDDHRASHAWGAMGNIERMEACLQRQDARRLQQRNATSVFRQVEALMAGGQRLAALDLAAHVVDAAEADSRQLRDLMALVGSRLLRGGSVSFRAADGTGACFASLPASLGRDPGGQVVLHDPGVSRRHARLGLGPDGALILEDVGSRAGTMLCGARFLGAVALPAAGEIMLGPTCRIGFALRGADRIELWGLGGLDRNLRALVGLGPLPLSTMLSDAGPLHVRPGERSARLESIPPAAIRLDGQLAGPALDLLHQDAIELTAIPGLRLEVL